MFFSDNSLRVPLFLQSSSYSFIHQNRQQKRAKRLEDMETGKGKPLVEDPSQLDDELAK